MKKSPLLSLIALAFFVATPAQADRGHNPPPPDPLPGACDSDWDGDGLLNVVERIFGLDPHNPDTDGDTIGDGVEWGPNEVPRDTDLDGFIDPLDLDTDSDRILDADEAGDADLVHAARGLSAERRRAAHAMAGAVAAQLDDLNLPSAGFETHFEHRSHPDGLHIDSESEPIAFDESGIDVAEFLISPNIGQPLRPLAEIASEGERSRVLLALKVVLAKVDETPTLIFDEIDVGVGSRTGSLVGQKLSALSAAHQVLCVTHLAPVAAFADTHFVVAKSSVGDTSLMRVGPVKGRQAIEELAAMSGASTTAGQHVARDLVSAANVWKDGHSSS